MKKFLAVAALIAFILSATTANTFGSETENHRLIT